MADELTECLKTLVGEADAHIDQEEPRRIRRFADELRDQLRSNHPEETDYDPVTKAASDWADLCRAKDCCRIIEKSFLKAAQAKAITTRVSADRIKFQSIIDEAVFENRVERGFVYVLWRLQGDRLLYVGKAGSADRLDLKVRGDLMGEVHTATRFSILIPHRSDDDTLYRLEGAIIDLYELVKGEKPSSNIRKASKQLFRGEGFKEFEREIKRIRKVATEMERFLWGSNSEIDSDLFLKAPPLEGSGEGSAATSPLSEI